MDEIEGLRVELLINRGVLRALLILCFQNKLIPISDLKALAGYELVPEPNHFLPSPGLKSVSFGIIQLINDAAAKALGEGGWPPADDEAQGR